MTEELVGFHAEAANDGYTHTVDLVREHFKGTDRKTYTQEVPYYAPYKSDTVETLFQQKIKLDRRKKRVSHAIGIASLISAGLSGLMAEGYFLDENLGSLHMHFSTSPSAGIVGGLLSMFGFLAFYGIGTTMKFRANDNAYRLGHIKNALSRPPTPADKLTLPSLLRR